ncbi:MAG: Gfo/Idh/MocA family protein [Chloroflexota bacterium]
MERVRIGIVGMGHRGIAWINTIRLEPLAEVVAVCERMPVRLQQGAARAGLRPARVFAELDDMLACSDVDAVAVNVEPEYIAVIAARSLDAGKHVISEVPLGYTVEDCWRVVLATERSGRVFAMAEQRSYMPFVRAWRQLIEEGLLGKPIYGEAQYFHGLVNERVYLDEATGREITAEEAQGNPHARKNRPWTLLHPLWYSPHSLGPLLAVLGGRVTDVSCMSTRKQSYYREFMPIPDIEVAIMKHDGDCILRIACGFQSPSASPHHWQHLIGTLGEVETSRRWTAGGGQADGSLLWLANHYMPGRSEVDWGFNEYQRGLPGASVSVHGGSDLYPLHDFVEGVLRGKRPLVDVYRAAEIAGPSVIAGHSADQGGQVLSVPDFRPSARRSAGQAPAGMAL